MCGGDGAVACCELCGAEAAVHCEADAAFLCAGCDAKVHGANFLASRHRRRRVTEGVVGEMGGCDGDESGTSSASSSCMSTADSATTPAAATRGQRHRQQPRGWRRSTNPKRRARGEVMLEGWAKRMGLAAGAARRRAAAAGHVLRACGRDAAMARVPLRVAMAAALWLEVAAHSAGAGAGQADTLQRLEACAHVPARLIVAVAASMGRARATWQAAVDAEESWDECS